MKQVVNLSCYLWIYFYAMQIKTFYLYSKNQQKITFAVSENDDPKTHLARTSHQK